MLKRLFIALLFLALVPASAQAQNPGSTRQVLESALSSLSLQQPIVAYIFEKEPTMKSKIVDQALAASNGDQEAAFQSLGVVLADKISDFSTTYAPYASDSYILNSYRESQTLVELIMEHYPEMCSKVADRTLFVEMQGPEVYNYITKFQKVPKIMEVMQKSDSLPMIKSGYSRKDNQNIDTEKGKALTTKIHQMADAKVEDKDAQSYGCQLILEQYKQAFALPTSDTATYFRMEMLELADISQ